MNEKGRYGFVVEKGANKVEIKKEVEKVENFPFKSATNIFNEIFPTRYMTRDSGAMTGHYVVPHIYYQAIAMYVRDFPEELKRFIFEIKK